MALPAPTNQEGAPLGCGSQLQFHPQVQVLVQTEQEFRFDNFRLIGSRRLLLEDDRPIRIGSRALDLLTALLERAGDVVSKEDLLAYAWPTTVVEETSLRFHMSSLRKAIGDGQNGARFIANVSGRGYCFVAKVERVHRRTDADAPAPTQAPDHAHNLPVRLTRMLGRAELVQSIARMLPERRFISVVGPGGMGKSTLALALCEVVLNDYPNGAWFVDLSPLTDPSLVAGAIAAVLGVGIHESDPMRNLAAFARDKRMLVVLDNCERVIEAAAVMAQGLLTIGKDIHVIATSREQLGAKGEWVIRIPPLALPESTGELTISEAMEYPAVQLFVERAVASVDSFELSPWDIDNVVNICRRLDGMPLAIELAAARVDAFGVTGLLAQLDDRFPLLSQGRRAVPGRHQTLRALLDWSHDLLTMQEQNLLRRLSVFCTAFTMEAAQAVAVDVENSPADVAEGIISLAAKSLVLVISSGDEMVYRLLDTTRAYAAERLEDSADRDEVQRRHALYICELLERAEADWMTMSRQEWLAIYARYIDDLRSALDWALKSDPDVRTNVRLAAGAGALAHQLSLQAEFLQRIRLAMARYQTGSERDPLLELHLNSALAVLSFVLQGPSKECNAMFQRALEMAEEIGADQYRADGINGLWVVAFGSGDYRAALVHAESIARIASQAGDVTMSLTADRLKAQSLFQLGDMREARRLAERVLRHPTMIRRLGSPYPFDRRVSMRITLTQVLWVEGYPDQAVEVAAECLMYSEAEHAFAQCIVLSWASCPVALWTGNHELARIAIDRFERHAMRHGFAHQVAWAREYARVLAFQESGEQGLEQMVESASSEGFQLAQTYDVLGTMHPRFLKDESIARIEAGQADWCAAEIIRARGERLLERAYPDDEDAAMALFEESLRRAQHQGALSWEMRAATSMARLLRKRGAPTQAYRLLDATYAKFTEGFGTYDLRQAKLLLDELHDELGDASTGG